MKKIKLFLYNIKNSWVFLGVIFVELVLCMILLSIAMTNFLGVNNQFAYFNKKVADNPFVTFDGYSLENDTTVSNISEYLSDDLSTLATAVNIGGVVSADIEYSTPYVTIATPALCQNFNNKGLKFSKDISDEYREAYVAEKYSSIYEKGEMYDIAVGSDDDICYSQKVKIKGYIEGQNYYAFSSGYIYFRPADIVICDKLPQFANLSSGIFVDGNSVDYYKDLGFKVTTVQKYYDMSKDSSPFTIYLYLAVIVILFTFVTILCNYVLSVDKLAKRNATMFVYGNTATAGIVNEGIKMLFAFLLAFATGIGIAELIVYLGVQRQNIMITMPHFYLSALIVLGVYVLAIVIGFIKFASAKPLKVINNMKDE